MAARDELRVTVRQGADGSVQIEIGIQRACAPHEIGDIHGNIRKTAAIDRKRERAMTALADMRECRPLRQRQSARRSGLRPAAAAQATRALCRPPTLTCISAARRVIADNASAMAATFVGSAPNTGTRRASSPPPRDPPRCLAGQGGVKIRAVRFHAPVKPPSYRGQCAHPPSSGMRAPSKVASPSSGPVNAYAPPNRNAVEFSCRRTIAGATHCLLHAALQVAIQREGVAFAARMQIRLEKSKAARRLCATFQDAASRPKRDELAMIDARIARKCRACLQGRSHAPGHRSRCVMVAGAVEGVLERIDQIAERAEGEGLPVELRMHIGPVQP